MSRSRPARSGSSTQTSRSWRPPATWEEFLTYLEATTTADKTAGGLSLGLKVTQTGFNWIYEQLAFAYLGQQRFEALFGKGTTAGFGSPDGLRTLDLYAQLKPYWIPGVSALGIDEADIAFAQGKSAFNVGGTFTLAFLAQNGMKPENVLTFPIPPATGGAVSDLRLAPGLGHRPGREGGGQVSAAPLRPRTVGGPDPPPGRRS